MPGISERKLEKAARREKNHTAKFRILACLARKRGHSVRRISRDLKTPYSTVRDWLLRMRDRGLRGRFNSRPKGRSVKISIQILRTVRKMAEGEPKNLGFEAGSWQTGMVIEVIRREFGVAVKARTLRRWLRRIRFSWRKDRYVPSGPPQKRSRGSSRRRSRSVRRRGAPQEGRFLSRTRRRFRGRRPCLWVEAQR